MRAVGARVIITWWARRGGSAVGRVARVDTARRSAARPPQCGQAGAWPPSGASPARPIGGPPGRGPADAPHARPFGRLTENPKLGGVGAGVMGAGGAGGGSDARFVDTSCPAGIRDGRIVADGVSVLFECGAGGGLQEGGFEIRRIELRAYVGDGGTGGGLITSVVHTDRGSIEMVYDADAGGGDKDGGLGRAVGFLRDHMGLSGVILRSVIELEANRLRDR